LGFFLEILRGPLVPSAGKKIPVQPGWYFPQQKIPLAENRFLHAGEGAENTRKNPSCALRLQKFSKLNFLNEN
jgi:hypothetical protein